MSSLLYRLARWCVAHAWRVLAIWLVVLAGVGALAVTVGKPLSSRVSIPGTSFEKVLDRLGAEIPEAAGGFGSVVLESDGDEFTEAQRAAIEEVFATWEQVPHVKGVINPFEAQDRLDASAEQLTAAKAKLDEGQAKLDEGRAQLLAAEGQLGAGKSLLDQLVAADPDDPCDPGLRAQIEEGTDKVESGKAELGQGRGRAHRGPRAVPGRRRRERGDRRHPPGQRGRAPRRRAGALRRERPVGAAGRPGPDPAAGHRRPGGRRRDAALQPRDHPGDRARRARARSSASASRVLVLVVVLGSLVAAGLPLLVALLGVGVGLGGAIALTSVVELDTTTPALRADARARGRHRLRAVHRQPAPRQHPARDGPARVDRAVRRPPPAAPWSSPAPPSSSPSRAGPVRHPDPRRDGLVARRHGRRRRCSSPSPSPGDAAVHGHAGRAAARAWRKAGFGTAGDVSTRTVSDDDRRRSTAPGTSAS